MRPSVKIERFKEWYFDGDTKKSEGKTLIENLIKNNKVSITIEEVFNNCGYIPARICENLTKEQQKDDSELEFSPSEVDFIHEQEVEKFARKDTKTGKGMNEGYCVNDGEAYFKEEKDLIEYLRKDQDEETKKLSDKFILDEAYDLEEFYHTEWEVEEGESWFDKEGDEFKTCHKCNEETAVNEDFYFCTHCLTHL